MQNRIQWNIGMRQWHPRYNPNPRGFSLKKILVQPPPPRPPQKKIRKIRKKSKEFKVFLRFKIRIPYLGVKDSSNSVFKSFFIYKIYITKKSEKIRKNLKKSNKCKDFFRWFKIRTLYLEWKNPRFQCLNPFLFIKSSYTQKKSKNPKNSKKSEKSEKQPIQGFLRI